MMRFSKLSATELSRRLRSVFLPVAMSVQNTYDPTSQRRPPFVERMMPRSQVTLRTLLAMNNGLLSIVSPSYRN